MAVAFCFPSSSMQDLLSLFVQGKVYAKVIIMNESKKINTFMEWALIFFVRFNQGH